MAEESGGWASRQAEYTSVDVKAIESRADVDSLDLLHHKRRVLLVHLNPLKALHGSFGLWDDRRKQMLEAMKVKARQRLAESGQKTTEGMVESEAYADPDYLAFLDQGYEARIAYLTMHNELDEIAERIRSRELELAAYSAEVRLQR